MFRSLFTALRALIYAAIFIWLWTWLAVSVSPLDDCLGLTLPPWLAPIGWFLAALGALLVLACLYFFVSVGKGTPAIFDAPRQFVAVGPYRFVRNPMYLGAAATMLGCGLGFRSLSVSLLTLVFVLFAHVFVLTYEEPALRRRFGPSYDRYCNTAHRWRPTFGARPDS